MRCAWCGDTTDTVWLYVGGHGDVPGCAGGHKGPVVVGLNEPGPRPWEN